MADLEAEGLVRDDVEHFRRRLGGAKGERAAQLHVAWKGLGLARVRKAEVADQSEVAGIARLECLGEAEVVPRHEGRKVDCETASGQGGGNVAGPDGRGREVARKPGTRARLAAGRHELGVFDLGDDLLADLSKSDQPGARRLPEIERQRRRSKARFDLRDIEVAAGDAVLPRGREGRDDPPGRTVRGDRNERPLGGRRRCCHGRGSGQRQCL